MADTRNLHGILLRRDADAKANADNQAAHRSHEFRVEVYGPGLVKPLRCDFSWAFVIEPSVRSGSALLAGDQVIQTYPEARVSVIRWHRNDAGLYIAADVVIRTIGHPRQRMTVGIKFSGVAVTLLGNSISPTSTLDDL